MTRPAHRSSTHRPAAELPLTDRAEAILNSTGRVALSVHELAGRLDTSPATLTAQLEGDDRFVLIQPATFPDLSLLADRDRRAYDNALQAAGVHPAPSIALRAPVEEGSRGSVDLLLRNSVTRLLAETPEEGLIAAAERMRLALSGIRDTRACPVGTAPTTIPPPDPPGPPSAPPRRRRPPGHRPPYPGSRRE